MNNFSKKIIVIGLICFSISSFAMKREGEGEESERGTKAPRIEPIVSQRQLSQFESMPSGPKLVFLEQLINASETPEQAVYKIRKLRELSRNVKTFIESPDTTKFIIERLAQRFNCYEFNITQRKVLRPKVSQLIQQLGIAATIEFFWQNYGIRVTQGRNTPLFNESFGIFFSELEAADLLNTSGVSSPYIQEWLNMERSRIIFMRQLRHGASNSDLVQKLLDYNKNILKLDLNNLKICDEPFIYNLVWERPTKRKLTLLLNAGADPFIDWIVRFSEVIEETHDEIQLRNLLEENKLTYKKNINSLSFSGLPLLFWMIFYDWARGIEILVEYGANPNIRNINGETLFTDFSKEECDRELDSNEFIKVLSKVGAPINDFDANGENILTKYLKEYLDGWPENQMQKFFDIIELLLKSGADPNIKTPHGKTPMEYALLAIVRNPSMQNNNKLLMQLLMRYGGNPDVKMSISSRDIPEKNPKK